ncbi:MAG: homocysteine S-methyltransferase family protein [Pseudomonadota bacterium]
MNRYTRLMNRIAARERILIDGATGTEIERLGVPQLDDAWNGGGALSHPDVLRKVHQDYISAGAEIVIANTFATHLHALEDAGVADQFDALNRRGVELAVEARQRAGKPAVLVAGGLSYWAWSGNWRSPEELGPPARQQAAIMAEAGADLLMLEMMVDIPRMLAVLDAALVSGLPVWVGLSCKRGDKPDDGGDMVLLRGGSLAAALEALGHYDVPVLSIMHTEVEDIDACLDVVEAVWQGPVGVYAHSARWQGQVGIFDETIPPATYAACAKRWMDRDVQVIGGCCGLGVDHIERLSEIV